MAKAAKAAATAAANAAVNAAANAAAEAASSLPANVRDGVRVTLAFLFLLYLFLFAQATMKRKLRAHHKAQGKKFDRYFSRDRKMLGWDRTVGNMLEQAIPFLTLFWLGIWLSLYGGLPHSYVAAAGWAYVALRSIYPVLWFSGGGGLDGTSPVIWRVTIPMYAIVVTLAINALVVICSV